MSAYTSRERRGLNVLIAIAGIGGLVASSALTLAEDPRPLDVQLRDTMGDAGVTLKAWEQQLSLGLRVSLRAVADGRDAPARQPLAALAPALLPASATVAVGIATETPRQARSSRLRE